MEELEPIDFTSADIPATWARSMLAREAVARIVAIAATRTEWEPQHLEAVYLTVARISDLLMTAAVSSKPLTQAEMKECGDAFLRFIAVLSPQVGRHHAPPPPPEEWLKSMRAWMLSVPPTVSRRGAPSKEFDLYAYPLLLSLYRLISSAEPAATAGGPTERFLAAFSAEMRSSLLNAKFTGEAVERRVRECFAEVTMDALRMKIRRMKEASAKDDALLNFFWRRFVTALAGPLVIEGAEIRH